VARATNTDQLTVPNLFYSLALLALPKLYVCDFLVTAVRSSACKDPALFVALLSYLLNAACFCCCFAAAAAVLPECDDCGLWFVCCVCVAWARCGF
jgi:hypothetical protein